jgi:hypothetical protein
MKWTLPRDGVPKDEVHDVLATDECHSPPVTAGHFLNAVDMTKTVGGIEARPENQRIYLTLFHRTLIMSPIITGSCILLGYPVAYPQAVNATVLHISDRRTSKRLAASCECVLCVAVQCVW